MIKLFYLAILAICLAAPREIGSYVYGYRGHGVYGGALVGSTGVSSSSREDVFGPAIAYSAGVPFPGAIVLPHGVNAGYAHASQVAVATPIFGTVPISGYGNGFGDYGGHRHY